MAAVSTSRRALAGIIFIVAGVLLGLAIVLQLLAVAFPYLGPLAHLAIAVALIVLAVGAVNSTVAKIALFAGGVGWLLLGILGFGLALPAPLTLIAAVLASLGMLIGAIVVYVGKEVTNTAALAFVITAIVGLIYLLPTLGVTALGAISLLIAIVFAAGLIITGVLFRRTERRSRR
jgi:hypothetical protein